MRWSPPSANSSEVKNTDPGDSDFEDLYENAPCGYLSVRPDGRIDRANRTLAEWMGYPVGDLPGMRLRDLLNMAGRIFFVDEQGQDRSCTGSTINSAGKRIVFTAGHCVHGGGAGHRFFDPNKWVTTLALTTV